MQRLLKKKMFNSSLFSSEKGLILADFCTSSKTPWNGSNMAMVCSGLNMMCESRILPQIGQRLPPRSHNLSKQFQKFNLQQNGNEIQVHFPPIEESGPRENGLGGQSDCNSSKFHLFLREAGQTQIHLTQDELKLLIPLALEANTKLYYLLSTLLLSKFAHVLETEPLLRTDQSLLGRYSLPLPFVDLPFTVGPVSKVGSSSNYYLLVDSSSNLNPFSFSLSIS